jgi:catechol 2,3-dioxygenase-like lactoylglutathione lyase family enzyme
MFATKANQVPASDTADARTFMKQTILHAALVVRDYDEAIELFCDKLHFELVEDTYQPEQDKRWVLVAPPGSTGSSTLLARASNPEQEASIGRQTGGRVFLVLGTDDFWRDFTEMRSRGVRFVREPKEAPYGTVAVFEDLYGNLWDLIQLKSPGSPDVRLSA